jgi:hypothetical protein
VVAVDHKHRPSEFQVAASMWVPMVRRQQHALLGATMIVRLALLPTRWLLKWQIQTVLEMAPVPQTILWTLQVEHRSLRP